MSKLIGFPEMVNEFAARLVASGVAVLGITTLATGSWWIAAMLAAGFAARVLAGPRFSPLARAALAIAPVFGPPRDVPGPPKRFAQAVGFAFASAAAGAALAFSADGVATVLIGVLVGFATLEAVFGFCAGCVVFGALMRIGVIPQKTCEACADLRSRAQADWSAAPGG